MQFLIKYLLSSVFFIMLLVVPFDIVFAQVGNFKDLTTQVVRLLNTATVVVLALAVAYFFYNIVQNLIGMASKSEEKQKELRETLTWGIIIIFVMVSLWGIIAILQRTLINGL